MQYSIVQLSQKELKKHIKEDPSYIGFNYVSKAIYPWSKNPHPTYEKEEVVEDEEEYLAKYLSYALRNIHSISKVFLKKWFTTEPKPGSDIEQYKARESAKEIKSIDRFEGLDFVFNTNISKNKLSKIDLPNARNCCFTFRKPFGPLEKLVFGNNCSLITSFTESQVRLVDLANKNLNILSLKNTCFDNFNKPTEFNVQELDLVECAHNSRELIPITFNCYTAQIAQCNFILGNVIINAEKEAWIVNMDSGLSLNTIKSPKIVITNGYITTPYQTYKVDHIINCTEFLEDDCAGNDRIIIDKLTIDNTSSIYDNNIVLEFNSCRTPVLWIINDIEITNKNLPKTIYLKLERESRVLYGDRMYYDSSVVSPGLHQDIAFDNINAYFRQRGIK